MINLHDQMNALMRKRSIFHSEADFQFSLAWEMQKAYPYADIRLEYCPAEHTNMHLDIFIRIDGKSYPIELKYKTLMAQFEIEGERYNLKSQGAHDLGSYDYLIDVERIELLKKTMPSFEKGYAIMLSNDYLYWDIPKSKKTTVFDSFRIHDGCEKGGLLNWTGNPSAGTTKDREKPINLHGKYQIEWREYSQLSQERNGTFNYLLLEINK